MVSEHVEGDQVEHERYGLGTVEARAETATGYALDLDPASGADRQTRTEVIKLITCEGGCMARRQNTTTDETERRTSAELVDDADDPAEWYVLPPTVDADDEVPEAILAAVEAAAEENPNAASDLTLSSAAGDGHAVAVLSARYEEQPVSADDGTLKGWRPPYQAREDFDATLTDELGDDYHAEHKNGHATTFYAEVSR